MLPLPFSFTYCEITVDSRAVVRNARAITRAVSSVSPLMTPCITAVPYHTQDVGLDTAEIRNICVTTGTPPAALFITTPTPPATHLLLGPGQPSSGGHCPNSVIPGMPCELAHAAGLLGQRLLSLSVALEGASGRLCDPALVPVPGCGTGGPRLTRPPLWKAAGSRPLWGALHRPL